MRSRLVALLGAGLVLIGSTSLPAQTPPLVTVGKRQVEVVQMGEGSPALILESGGGEGVSQWTKILPELAKHTRVISYSRAGFGRSTASTIPGSPQLSVAELHQLLEALGQTGPVILAGHSWGGLLARLYVSRYPAGVAGLVLIDATHEAQVARWEALKPGVKIADLIRSSVAKATPATRDLYEQFLRVSTLQRVEGMTPLPDIPIAAITSVKAAPPSCPPTEAWMCTPEAMAMWRGLHAEWVSRSTSSLHIVSAKVGHYVMYDQPALVVDAVKFVLDQVRQR